MMSGGIGQVLDLDDNRLLVVVYNQRDERIRLISARAADPYEQRRYHEHNQ
jgi:uncharacterized DUF497 family protein